MSSCISLDLLESTAQDVAEVLAMAFYKPAPTTFSIVAADLTTGELGIAVQSKFLAVGSLVPWVRAGVGAIATQALPNASYGPAALEHIGRGMSAQEALQAILSEDELRENRQYGIVDARGRSATFTGAQCIESASGIAGDSFAAQGNCLASREVVDAIASSFRSSRGHLADRLIAALRGGQAAGGDKRGQQSAALTIEKPKGGYMRTNDRFVDLRVDDHAEPIEELTRILELHKLYFFPPKSQDIIQIDTAIGAEIVQALCTFGDLPPGTTTFDANARAALHLYMGRENLENRIREDATIDRQTLEYLRSAVRRSPLS